MENSSKVYRQESFQKDHQVLGVYSNLFIFLNQTGLTCRCLVCLV